PGPMVEPYEPGRRHKLFHISVALHPDYQNRGLSRLLRAGVRRYLLNKRKAGIDIDAVLAFSVSQGGEHFLRKLGFSPLKTIETGTSLYELTPDDAFYSAAREESNP